ncbi:metalloregulator ArsR/SmtB family transcription factor [Hydrotalea sp.]|uniref:ArsR/SmtB family transcription factor n=2 Tax=Hydrotalea sp. TaxID=2881279 RepID=UPI00260F4C1D|nr:metalloregulator ArsR/SmtB family transcription factor [Hydrotalea sp.]
MRACIRLYADPAQIQECKAKLTMANGAFTMLSGVLALAANEVRLKILYLLEEEKELCPCDISDILGMSIPAISQHLRKMKDGGMIQARKEGQTIFYALKPGHIKMLRGLFKYMQQLNQQNQLV